MEDIHTALTPAGISAGDIDLGKIGEWQHVPTTDKPNKRNGHVKVFDSNPTRLWFKNMATDVAGYYADEPNPFRQSRRSTAAPPVEIRDTYASAAQIAKHNWDTAVAACPDHPYLKAKQVRPHGVRQLGQSLIIPMRDRDHLLWSTQTIHPDGSTRYMKGGRKRGCYCPIGGMPNGLLFLAEGFATAATIAECTGIPVAVCFDAGNLQPVAEVLSLKFPRTELIVCADNDVGTDGNPGVSKATDAAATIGGRVFWPVFPDGVALTDWNDMQVHYGRDVVRDNLLALL